VATAAVGLAGAALVAGPFASVAAAKVPATFSPMQAAAAPGSSTSFVLGSNGSGHTVVLKYGGGHSSVSTVHTTVSMVIVAIAAGSTKSVWVGGSVYRTNAYQPLIEHSTGHGWRAVKLPALGTGGYIKSLAASSPTNAWAVGMLPSTDGETSVLLHWNGKAWLVVKTTQPTGTVNIAVATSSPTNVWMITQGEGFVHYNGHSFSVSKATIAGTLSSIATSGPTKAWAIGTRMSKKGTSLAYAMRDAGRRWVSAATPAVGYSQELTQVSMRGSTAWAVGYSLTKTTEAPYLLRAVGAKLKRVAVPRKGNGGDLSAVAATSSHGAVAFGRYVTGTGCINSKDHPLVVTASGAKAKAHAVAAVSTDISRIERC
jgi:hypothetical protein